MNSLQQNAAELNYILCSEILDLNKRPFQIPRHMIRAVQLVQKPAFLFPHLLQFTITFIAANKREITIFETDRNDPKTKFCIQYLGEKSFNVQIYEYFQTIIGFQFAAPHWDIFVDENGLEKYSFAHAISMAFETNMENGMPTKRIPICIRPKKADP